MKINKFRTELVDYPYYNRLNIPRQLSKKFTGLLIISGNLNVKKCLWIKNKQRHCEWGPVIFQRFAVISVLPAHFFLNDVLFAWTRKEQET